MTRAYADPDALWSCERLAGELGAPGLVVLDGSFFLPGSGRTPAEGFARLRIPGARLFEIDGICDPATDLPHMLPAPERFADAVEALGVGNGTRVVVYDQPGSLAAPRVWWTFRVFGHSAISVLDGGLARWMAEGRPTEKGPPAGTSPSPARFTPRFDVGRVRSANQVLALLNGGDGQIVDNRPAGRWAGRDPEPRPARKAGHIPGARSLPFAAFVDPARDNVWLSADEIARRFAAAGIDPARPVVAYCGSGVTACTTAFAAHLLGHDTVAVYDGSWAEWGNRDDTPVEAGDGPARG